MQQRDANDSGRALSPLRPASDAVFVDSTARTVQEVVDEMLGVIADTQGR
jgi:cytidylate kinase